MNKSQAVREVVKENFGLTNKQIKTEVRHRFGLLVETNEIINTVGPFKKRIQITGYQDHLIKKAKDFLHSVGDYRLARDLLAIAETS